MYIETYHVEERVKTKRIMSNQPVMAIMVWRRKYVIKRPWKATIWHMCNINEQRQQRQHVEKVWHVNSGENVVYLIANGYWPMETCILEMTIYP
jgi:hypothetical protein